MEFNNDFAAKTWDLISKMDDDEAQMFVRFVAYDVLMQDIENNRRTIDRAVSEIHKSIQDDLAGKLPEDHSQLVSTVSKAWGTNYEEKYHKYQPRDNSGRWSVTISREKNKVKPAKLKGRGDVNIGQFNLTGALAHTGDEINEFERRWNNRGQDEMGTTSGMYTRIGAGAHVLNETGKRTGNAKLRLAGEAGEFFGKYGPQAEAVVGPHMRRTAYRYRGTERTPDAALVKAVKDQIGIIGHNEGLTSNSEFTPAMMNTASHRAAVNYLSQRLPSKNLAELQQASGKIPPSEGVMINADGKVIAQAVGYMDDHYLPFNLKNLKGLQGGSYVRSRSSGGLTTEDIYTGLVSGARSVTVVSRSGVFTIDFEDDFRGGRRFNDKAAGMISRYAKTLDAVKSEKVQSRPMSATERLKIRDEVEGDMIGYRHDEIEDEIARRVKEARTNPTISAAEMREIDSKAVAAAAEGGKTPRGQFTEREWAQIKDDPKKRILAYKQQMVEDLMLEKQSQKFQLDGEGYAAAQDALREQFPYYIARSTYIHNKDPRARGMGLSGEKDSGYVKPRFNRPQGAQEGYFDASINGQGKRSADQTNYQNWSVRRKPEADRTKDVTAEENAEPSKMGDAQRARQTIANRQAEKRVNEELEAIASSYAQQNFDAATWKSYPLLKQYRDEDKTMAEILGDEKLKRQLEQELKGVHTVLGGVRNTHPEVEEAWTAATKRFRNVENFRATRGDTPFNAATYNGEASPRQAFIFEGPEYTPGTPDPSVYQRAWSQVNDRLGRNMGLQAGYLRPDMTDDDLRRAADKMGAMYRVAKKVESGDLKDRFDILDAVSDAADASLTSDQVNDLARDVERRPDRMARNYGQSVELIERARRIKIAAGDALSEAPKAPEKAATATVQGQVLSSKPAAANNRDMNKRTFLAELDQDAQDMDEDSEVGGLLFSLNHGLTRDDMEEIKIALDELRDEVPELYKKYRKRLTELGLWMADND